MPTAQSRPAPRAPGSTPWRHRLRSCALALLLSAATPPAAAAERCLAIVGTNDVHGHVDPDVHRAGALEVGQGGLATFAGYLQILRDRYPKRTLLLDGGDLFQGTVVSNLSKGAAVIAAYNALGYQATALGNHEFDFGAEGDPADLQGAIKHRIAEAHFPFLAANVYEKKTGRRPAWRNLLPSTMVTIDGVRVGLVGAVTVDTPNVTLPPHVASLEFRAPAPEIAREAKRLRRAGARLVVLVAHIGASCRDLRDPDDLASCAPDSELFDTLNALPKGAVDVAIAGHTHQYVEHRVNGVAVSENGSYGRSFGWVEACVPTIGPVRTTLHPPIDLCTRVWADGPEQATPGSHEGACEARKQATGTAPARFLGVEVQPQPAIDALLQPFRERVVQTNSAATGVTLAVPLAKERERPSPLGQMVAEGLRRAVPGAEIGFMNSGGIRAPLPAGPITYGQIFEVLPFDNHVVSLQLTGAQLVELVAAPMRAGHGAPQLAGARWEGDRQAPRVVLPDGHRIEPDRIYRVATNDFLADGGDGTRTVLGTLPKDRRQDLATLMRDAFLGYLKSLPQPVTP